MTAAELLDAKVVCTLEQTAFILEQTHRSGAKKGQPDRRLVLELIAAGKLRVVDPDQPARRWTISTQEIRRYRDAGVAA